MYVHMFLEFQNFNLILIWFILRLISILAMSIEKHVSLLLYFNCSPSFQFSSVLYPVCTFHDEWTDRTDPELILMKSLYIHSHWKCRRCSSSSVKLLFWRNLFFSAAMLLTDMCLIIIEVQECPDWDGEADLCLPLVVSWGLAARPMTLMWTVEPWNTARHCVIVYMMK